MHTRHPDAEQMAKRQRSVQLPAEVYVLTRAFESRTGAKFNRQTLAALLAFFFDWLDESPKAGLPGPDPLWMQLALALERDELSIDDIPSRILDQNIASGERSVRTFARFKERSPGTDSETRYLEAAARLKRAQQLRGQWDERVADCGDARQAILQMLDGSLAGLAHDLATPRMAGY